MQDKKRTFVHDVFDALQEYLNLESYQEVADYFGVKHNTWYSWAKRGKIADTGLILGKRKEIELKYLQTGKGPMIIVDKSNIDQVAENWPRGEQTGKMEERPKLPPPKKSNVTATIQPGTDRDRRRIGERRTAGGVTAPAAAAQTGQSENDDAENYSIADMMQMTARVLESKTVYRSALASNVRAFYQAVVKEDEMQSLTENIEEMRAENREMKEELREMKEMLLSMGGQVEEKKRAQ